MFVCFISFVSDLFKGVGCCNKCFTNILKFSSSKFVKVDFFYSFIINFRVQMVFNTNKIFLTKYNQKSLLFEVTKKSNVLVNYPNPYRKRKSFPNPKWLRSSCNSYQPQWFLLQLLTHKSLFSIYNKTSKKLKQTQSLSTLELSRSSSSDRIPKLCRRTTAKILCLTIRVKALNSRCSPLSRICISRTALTTSD